MALSVGSPDGDNKTGVFFSCPIGVVSGFA